MLVHLLLSCLVNAVDPMGNFPLEKLRPFFLRKAGSNRVTQSSCSSPKYRQNVFRILPGKTFFHSCGLLNMCVPVNVGHERLFFCLIGESRHSVHQGETEEKSGELLLEDGWEPETSSS